MVSAGIILLNYFLQSINHFTILDNDIALLKLQDQLTFTDTISPACVNLGDDPTTGDIIAVTGWGTLSSGGSSSATLQEVAVSKKETHTFPR